jgi:protein-tyrosine phosphatase
MAIERLSVLMVCMGNICRSPMAEGVLRRKLASTGLHHLVEVDSAGTHGYQDGSPPDWRALAAAAARGYDLQSIRARRLRAADFERFDLVLAMDRENIETIEEICRPQLRDRVRLLMDFATEHTGVSEVPDAYYGPPAEFDRVLDLVEDACDGLLGHLRRRLDPGR